MTKSADNPIPIKVKICGLTSTEAVLAANRAKADLVGFVFFKGSPRHLDAIEAVRLASLCEPWIERVALFVDPNDDQIGEAVHAVSPHRIQLHGTETPERVAEIRAHTNCQIIKACPLACAEDLICAEAYYPVADWLLFDAPASSSGGDVSERPGGNGQTFDWSWLAQYNTQHPWMLSGGLTPDNVATAIRHTGARMVDVSSGVESAMGQKDPELIAKFIERAREKPPNMGKIGQNGA